MNKKYFTYLQNGVRRNCIPMIPKCILALFLFGTLLGIPNGNYAQERPKIELPQEKTATPIRCQGSDLVLAMQELTATRSNNSMKLRGSRNSKIELISLKYEPYPETYYITAQGATIPAITIGFQLASEFNQNWLFSVNWDKGNVTGTLSLSTKHISFETASCTDKNKTINPIKGIWCNIESKGSVPVEIINTINYIEKEMDTGPDECVQTTKWCLKYALRTIIAGIGCGLSLGTDTDACTSASEHRDDWANCKKK